LLHAQQPGARISLDVIIGNRPPAPKDILTLQNRCMI
jgi:hypothetical protein